MCLRLCLWLFLLTSLDQCFLSYATRRLRKRDATCSNWEAMRRWSCRSSCPVPAHAKGETARQEHAYEFVTFRNERLQRRTMTVQEFICSSCMGGFDSQIFDASVLRRSSPDAPKEVAGSSKGSSCGNTTLVSNPGMNCSAIHALLYTHAFWKS